MKKSGGLAFPQAVSDYMDHPVHGHIRRAEIGDYPETGMTLRQWYAGMVAPQVLATATGGRIDPTIIAQGAFAIADAMIKEGEKE